MNKIGEVVEGEGRIEIWVNIHFTAAVNSILITRNRWFNIIAMGWGLLIDINYLN